jgi:hypothetical protein
MEKDIVTLILNNSNIKMKYINILKQKILELNLDIYEKYDKKDINIMKPKLIS